MEIEPVAYQVDEQAGIVYGVPIMANPMHSSAARAQALKLLDGASVYLDGDGVTPRRRVTDKLGRIANLRTDQQGRMIGDLHLLRTHAQAAQVLELLGRFGEQMELISQPRANGLTLQLAPEASEQALRAAPVRFEKTPAEPADRLAEKGLLYSLGIKGDGEGLARAVKNY